ncbi:hypothetical protein [Xenorhabdus griffiniae]|uniref:hypothetical protein n=1 Tax=Xenorhabdus griffiniae TaxID=351672 RepID=UPI002359D3B9|nr:hypothetical protein [Xenorhabdus griffiniae]MDC9604359.1 hypothetical protein [Xenorhabdus griffiniae]
MGNILTKVFINWLEPCENCGYQGVYLTDGDDDFLCENDDAICTQCGHHGIIQVEEGYYRNHYFVSWDELPVKTEAN